MRPGVLGFGGNHYVDCGNGAADFVLYLDDADSHIITKTCRKAGFFMLF